MSIKDSSNEQKGICNTNPDLLISIMSKISSASLGVMSTCELKILVCKTHLKPATSVLADQCVKINFQTNICEQFL